MGGAVLDAASVPGALSPNDTLRVYAHCSTPGAVAASKVGLTLLLLNIDPVHNYTITTLQATMSNSDSGGTTAGGTTTSPVVTLPLFPRDEYVLTAHSLDEQTVMLNGKPLLLSGPDQQLPPLTPVHSGSSTITVQPRSIGYFVFPGAKLPACT